MDRGSLKPEATVIDEKNVYSIPVSIELFVSRAVADDVIPELRRWYDIRDRMPGAAMVRRPPPPPQPLRSGLGKPQPSQPGTASDSRLRWIVEAECCL